MNLGDIRTSVQKIVRYAAVVLSAVAVAACGGGGGSPGTVSGSSGSTSTTPSSISLLFSSTELPSSGAAGTEVTVTALVKNASNNAIASVPVTFTASSGALTAVASSTDANGKATAVLGTSGDRTNRTITVTAKAGNITATGTVSVVGTAVTITGPATVTAGSTSDFAITVRDQAGTAIPAVPVSIASARGNPIAIKTSGGGSADLPLTNSQGQVVVTVTGSQAGSDTLTASSQGNSFTYSYNVNSISLTVSTAASQANVGACTKIAARYENSGVGQNGTINISASRGLIYTDSACSSLLGSSSVSVTSGNAQDTYIKSDTVGVATLTATVVNGPTAQTSIEFVAPLTAAATISIQPDPAVISPSGTGQSNLSVLTAVVRDNGNFVKGAVIEFSIVSDLSGGTLSNPSVVTTGSDGSAKVTFAAGPATTATNGVQIQARIQGTSKTAVANLTVARKSLFITAGTGNTIVEPTNSTYRKDYTVFVTDAGGNPVPGVTVTATLKSISYSKGYYRYDSDQATPETGWIRVINATCASEDDDNDGILDAGEDANGSEKLEPGLSFSTTPSGKTDSSGVAEISILYPQDRGGWTDVRLTITGIVEGTEGTYTSATFTLPVAASDLTDQNVQPPGVISPYGTQACSSPN